MDKKMPSHEELERIIDELPVNKKGELTVSYLNFPIGTHKDRLYAWNDGLDTEYPLYGKN